MDRTERRKATVQATGVLLVLAGAAAWGWHAAHRAPDAQALAIVAQTACSQAVEAVQTGRLQRASALPRRIGANHLDQLRRQIARNRKSLKA